MNFVKIAQFSFPKQILKLGNGCFTSKVASIQSIRHYLTSSSHFESSINMNVMSLVSTEHCQLLRENRMDLVSKHLISRNVNEIGIPPLTSLRIVPISIPIGNIKSILIDEPKTYNQHRKIDIEDPLWKKRQKSEITEIIPNKSIIEEKEAARLVVIRRIKMNKHKLKKLRKRMKYVWAKVKLRRSIRKEKAFLNEQLAKIREAEAFDAKAYVDNILARVKYEPLPVRWKGSRMPPEMIRGLLLEDEKRKQKKYLSKLDSRKS